MGKRAKGRVYRNISGTKTGKIHTGRMREREEARRGGVARRREGGAGNREKQQQSSTETRRQNQLFC